ncbi:MAG TPA: winged helix-turn-helix domain-containing protein, partial [Candidatus Norongarragalinales archaeon]|nr:winged helix-turn-helix domain-containing protein [Candidatus Norongarragalinales archaeon]
MQFKKGADILIGSKARVQVLRLLAKFPHRGFTGREAARFAGVSASQALIALNDLRDNGVVQSRRIGRSIEWKANTKSALFRLLVPVMREGALMDMAAEDIRGAFS